MSFLGRIPPRMRAGDFFPILAVVILILTILGAVTNDPSVGPSNPVILVLAGLAVLYLVGRVLAPAAVARFDRVVDRGPFGHGAVSPDDQPGAFGALPKRLRLQIALLVLTPIVTIVVVGAVALYFTRGTNWLTATYPALDTTSMAMNCQGVTPQTQAGVPATLAATVEFLPVADRWSEADLIVYERVGTDWVERSEELATATSASSASMWFGLGPAAVPGHTYTFDIALLRGPTRLFKYVVAYADGRTGSRPEAIVTC